MSELYAGERLAELRRRIDAWAAGLLDANPSIAAVDPGTSDDTETDRDEIIQHGGGRFSLEAWPWPRLRLRAEYDLTTVYDLAPEIRGYKSLRILAEGSF